MFFFTVRFLLFFLFSPRLPCEISEVTFWQFLPPDSCGLLIDLQSEASQSQSIPVSFNQFDSIKRYRNLLKTGRWRKTSLNHCNHSVAICEKICFRDQCPLQVFCMNLLVLCVELQLPVSTKSNFGHQSGVATALPRRCS